MKRFPLLSFLPLVALVFAVACSDSTAPPNSGIVRVPTDAALVVGEPPPPPVDASVVVCAGGACVVVEGSYFSKGSGAVDAAITARAAGEGECLPGTAWLKFDNSQPPQGYDVTNTANAGIKCSKLRASGHGTIEFYVGTVEIEVFLDQVITFDNFQSCGTELCASFQAHATADGFPILPAEGLAFNREFYESVCGPPTQGGVSFCDPRGGGPE